MRILVAGASGFVGSAVVPALAAAGHAVRAGMRRKAPLLPDERGVEVVAFDLDDDASVAAALVEVDAVVYLVHGLDRPGFAAWEVESATRFAAACRRAGVQRVVYLGGVTSTVRTPQGRVPSVPSDHLRSRAQTGAALHAAAAHVLELRAGVVVGAGGASFRLVRDVAARAPLMVPAPWLAAQQQPIALADVVAAVVHAVAVVDGSLDGALDLPGPTTLATEAFLRMVCEEMGTRPRFWSVRLPVDVMVRGLVALTRADPAVIRALFTGADGADYVAVDDGLYARVPSLTRTPLRVAVRAALLAEERALPAVDAAVEALLMRVLR